MIVAPSKPMKLLYNSIGGTEYRDRFPDTSMEGNILHQFNAIMQFFTRNLRNVQVEENFNSLGELEIPSVALMEFTANALVHRSLVWAMPVRVFIFDDRVEIHSPGNLPAGMTVESIISGMSMPRNNLLFNNAAFLLPYTGAGSGLKRAMDTGIAVQFNDNEKTKEFVVTIPRKEHHVNAPSNQGVHHDTNEGPAKSKQGGSKSNEGLTKSNHSEVTKVTKPSITKKQLDIVNFCSVPRTAKEIMDRLGITNQTKNRQHYITELVEKGYLELTIPENPTNMNQKYRRTQISYKE